MEMKSVISAVLFFLSNCFAIAAISTASWIVNNFPGVTRYGLTSICIAFHSDNPVKEVCERISTSEQWKTTLVLIVVGICLMLVTIMMMLMALCKPSVAKMIRIVAFIAMFSLSIAAIIFPFGFYAKEVGGSAYKLPANTNVGYSFYLFIGSIVCLTAGNVLCSYEILAEHLAFRRR